MRILIESAFELPELVTMELELEPSLPEEHETTISTVTKQCRKCRRSVLKCVCLSEQMNELDIKKE